MTFQISDSLEVSSLHLFPLIVTTTVHVALPVPSRPLAATNRSGVFNCMQKYWRLFSIFFVLSRKKMGLGFLVDHLFCELRKL